MSIAAVFGGIQSAGAQSSGGSGATMKSLLQQGYEIKAAAPNGSKYVVFMQKDNSAYACEFVTVTSSRCGAINSEAN
ncbi:hypothetical protein [Hoeflea sp. TYP-13]|uniref:hypothetical protein n=1 Tax=Hoeflea sp. TYP-13 TaxID=3230023 RepID=UPI0034C68763